MTAPQSSTTPAFISMESSLDSPELVPVLIGSHNINHVYPASLPPPSPARALNTPLLTPPLSSTLLEHSSSDYSHGTLAKQQAQRDADPKRTWNDYRLEEYSTTESEVETQRRRIMQEEKSIELDISPVSSHSILKNQLLPAHMQNTGSRANLTLLISPCQKPYTVAFADQPAGDSPPTTPKGHPVLNFAGYPQGLAKHANIERHLGRTERSKAKVLDFFGGGAGISFGLKRGSSEKKWGKIYRPKQHSHTSALSPSQTFAGQRFRTTLSQFSRIPYRYRPIVAAVLGFLLFACTFMAWNADADQDRKITTRYAYSVQTDVVPADSFVPNKESIPLDAYGSKDTVDVPRDAAILSTPVIIDPGYQFQFQDKHQEMAALVSFLTSAGSNALPPFDPLRPLDPQLVLDFDYSKEATAQADMDQLVEDVWALFPIIIVGRMRDPDHREMLRIMSTYVLNPPPLIIEVDQRRDVDSLVPLLARLLDTTDLPQIIVNGRAAGGHSEITALHEAGTVKKHFTDLGLYIRDKKMKKKPKYVKDAERRENERILGPQPIER